MLPQIHDYEKLYREFRWPELARYNIGVDVCDRWAAQDASRLAILNVRADGRTEEITFGWLRETSNRLANTLAAHGVARGDRVAMLLPQTPEAAAGHIAIYKLGAIAVPLAILFGVDALTYRLQKIAELTGRDPADPTHRFELQTAVTGARLLGWPASS